MFEQLITQIQEFEALGQKNATFEILGIVIARLYQVDASQIQNIPAATLETIFAMLLQHQSKNIKIQSLLIYCDQALSIVERYRLDNQSELLRIGVELGNAIGDLRRRTQNQLTNLLQNKFTRLEAFQFTQELTSLKDYYRGLQILEQSKNNTDLLGTQYQKIDKAVQDFYRRQSEYWHEQWSKEIHAQVHHAMKQGEKEFQAAHRELEVIVKELMAMGLYDQARMFLAYQGLPSQVPNRAGSFLLKDLLEPIILLNEQHIGVLKTNKPIIGMWREYCNQLQEMRAKVKGDDIRAEQRMISETYLKILRSIFTRITCLLGPASKRFCLIAYGSLSRGDVTTNSDVEAGAILEDVSDRQTLEYLENFIQLWRYEMEALGESDATNAGFHFDTGGISIDVGVSINTNFVYDVNSYVREAIGGFGEDNTQLRPLFLYGDKNLFEETQKALPRLTEAQLKPVLSRTAKLLNNTSPLASLAASAASASSDVSSKTDLKEKYLHPMIWAITQLGLYHGLPQEHSSHPLDVLEWLGQQEILDLAFVRNCQQKLTILYQQRLFMNLSPLASSSSSLSSSVNVSGLKEIEAVVLKPLGMLLGWMSQSEPEKPGKRIKPYNPILDALEANTSETTLDVLRYYLRYVTSIDLLAHGSIEALCQRLCNHYKQLSSIQRELFWERLSEQQESYVLIYQALLQKLGTVSNSDGWSPELYNREQLWFSQLTSCLIPATDKEAAECKAGQIFLVQCLDLAAPRSTTLKLYRLPDRLYQAFFAGNRIRFDNEIQSIRHTVLPKDGLPDYPYCLKLLPENMPAELLCYELDNRLGGQGIPCGLPIKLILGNRSLAAYLMEDVRQAKPGTEIFTLAETLRLAKEKNAEAIKRLQRIDRRSFTETLLRVLLINPEDDKGNDYFLVPFDKPESSEPWYRFVRVDNERIFHSAQDATSKKTKPLVKSIIYLLNEMMLDNGLDKAVLARFLELDIPAFMQGLLKKLTHTQTYLKQLFTLSDVQLHYLQADTLFKSFTLRDTQLCWLLSGYNTVKLTSVIKRLHAVQGFIALFIQCHVPTPAFTLLRIIHADLVHFYAACFKGPTFYQENNPALASNRFEKFCNDYQAYTLNKGVPISQQAVNRVVTESMGLKEEKLTAEQINAIYEESQMSPAYWVAHSSELAVTQKQLVGKDLIQYVFLGNNLTDDFNLDVYEQTLLLTAIELMLQTAKWSQDSHALTHLKPVRLKQINLGLFKAIITPKVFERIIQMLKEDLEVLIIDGCAIAEYNLVNVLNNCQKLNRLILRHLDSLVWYAGGVVSTQSPWRKFSLDLRKAGSLKVLEIEDCSVLELIRITKINHLDKLTVIRSDRVKRVELVGVADGATINEVVTGKVEVNCSQLIIASQSKKLYKIVFSTNNFSSLPHSLRKELPLDFPDIIGVDFGVINIEDNRGLSHRVQVWFPGWRSSAIRAYCRNSTYMLGVYEFSNGPKLDAAEIVSTYGELRNYPQLEEAEVVGERICEYRKHCPDKPVVIVVLGDVRNSVAPQRIYGNIRQGYYNFIYFFDVDASLLKLWLLAILLRDEQPDWLEQIQDTLIHKTAQQYPDDTGLSEYFMVKVFEPSLILKTLKKLNYAQLEWFSMLVIHHQPPRENWNKLAYQQNAKFLMLVALYNSNLSVAQRMEHLLNYDQLLTYNPDTKTNQKLQSLAKCLIASEESKVDGLIFSIATRDFWRANLPKLINRREEEQDPDDCISYSIIKIIRTTARFEFLKPLDKQLSFSINYNLFPIGVDFHTHKVCDTHDCSYILQFWEMVEGLGGIVDPRFQYVGSTYMLGVYHLIKDFDYTSKVVDRYLLNYRETCPSNPIVMIVMGSLKNTVNFTKVFRSTQYSYYNFIYFFDVDSGYSPSLVDKWLLAIALQDEQPEWFEQIQNTLIQRTVQQYPDDTGLSKDFMVKALEPTLIIKTLKKLNYVQLEWFSMLVIHHQPPRENWNKLAYQQNAKFLMLVALYNSNTSVAQRMEHLLNYDQLLTYNPSIKVSQNLQTLIKRLSVDEQSEDEVVTLIIRLAKSNGYSPIFFQPPTSAAAADPSPDPEYTPSSFLSSSRPTL